MVIVEPVQVTHSKAPRAFVLPRCPHSVARSTSAPQADQPPGEHRKKCARIIKIVFLLA
jgi:hypothetical protein